MTRYRKLPTEIEAVRINATDFNGHDFDGNPFGEVAPEWLIDALRDEVVWPAPGDTDYAQWRIMTLEGEVLASPGDYIVRGIKGELYPCRGDIFEALHERVDAAA